MPLFRKIGHDGFRKPMWTSSLLKRRPHHMLHFSCVHHSFFCYHFLGNLNQGEYTFLSAPHHCELVSLVGNVALILLSKLIKFNILIFFTYGAEDWSTKLFQHSGGQGSSVKVRFQLSSWPFSLCLLHTFNTSQGCIVCWNRARQKY